MAHCIAESRSSICGLKRAKGAVRLGPFRQTVFRNTASKFTPSTLIASSTVAAGTTLSTSSPVAPVAPSTSPSHANASTFPWFQNWYPIGPVEDFAPGRPHAAHLLGIPLALWRDGEGKWHAVEDKCPHRMAPLSEGRVEADGTLQCAYHGWQFSGAGACTAIPQLRGDERAAATACASRRACVRAFPAAEVHGLLWVYADGSAEGWRKAAEEQPVPRSAIRELMGGPEGEGWRQCTRWFARDLPLRYDTLVENVLDPSHVPFAHHGVQGRRTNEKGTTTKPGELSLGGFSFEVDHQSPAFGTTIATFQAPSLARYTGSFRDLIVYAVPTKPGWTRLVATFAVDTRKPSTFRLPKIAMAILNFVDSQPWLEHITQRNAVLDGDTYMLHVQERLLLAEGNDWRKQYYMPAPADGSVVAFRKWLDAYGGAVPTCEPGTPLPPQLTKREAHDRYAQHTAHCGHCQKALRNVDRATVAAAAMAALAAAWLLCRGLLGLPLVGWAGAAGLAAAAGAAAAVAGLRALRQPFFYVDYVHADKH